MQTVFLTLLSMSLAGTAAILLVLLMRRLLRRAPKGLICILWVLIFLRLLCPPLLKSGFSLLPEKPFEMIRQAGQGELSAQPAPGGDGDLFDPVQTQRPAGGQDVGQTAGRSVFAVLPFVWALGSFLMLAHGGYALWRLRRTLRDADMLEKGVWISGRVTSPFVMGSFRPGIYLPADLEPSYLEHVLLHERMHIRRWDHVVRLIGYAALSVHWFNPLVWLAFRLSGRDMEAACDEAVLLEAGEDIRAAYAQTLLDLSGPVRRRPAAYLAFGENDTKERVKQVLQFKKQSKKLMLAAGLCVLAAAAVILLIRPAVTGGDGEAVIGFPAYEQENDPFAEAGPFTLRMELPAGWTWEAPPEGERNGLGTPVSLWDEEGNAVGSVWYSTYSPYDGEIAPEDYWNVAYASIRLGAHYFWTDFVSVNRTDTFEAHTATVYYQTPVEGQSAAAWPAFEEPGVCCYDKEKGVFVCVQMNEGSVTEEEQTAIARSLKIE